MELSIYGFIVMTKRPLHAYTDEKGEKRMRRLIINGDEIYELDEECLREKQKRNCQKRQFPQGKAQHYQKSQSLKQSWKTQQ